MRKRVICFTLIELLVVITLTASTDTSNQSKMPVFQSSFQAILKDYSKELTISLLTDRQKCDYFTPIALKLLKEIFMESKISRPG